MVLQNAARAAPPRPVPVGEASKIRHVHPNMLPEWSDRGLIPSYRAGRRRDRRFSVADLEDILERNGNVTEAQRRAADRLGD